MKNISHLGWILNLECDIWPLEPWLHAKAFHDSILTWSAFRMFCSINLICSQIPGPCRQKPPFTKIPSSNLSQYQEVCNYWYALTRKHMVKRAHTRSQKNETDPKCTTSSCVTLGKQCDHSELQISHLKVRMTILALPTYVLWELNEIVYYSNSHSVNSKERYE